MPTTKTKELERTFIENLEGAVEDFLTKGEDDDEVSLTLGTLAIYLGSLCDDWRTRNDPDTDVS